MAIILDGILGETFPSWTTSNRPALPAPGQVGFNSTTNSLECYSGSTWVAIGSNGTGTRTVSTSTPTGGSNGDIWYRY